LPGGDQKSGAFFKNTAFSYKKSLLLGFFSFFLFSWHKFSPPSKLQKKTLSIKEEDPLEK